MFTTKKAARSATTSGTSPSTQHEAVASIVVVRTTATVA